MSRPPFVFRVELWLSGTWIDVAPPPTRDVLGRQDVEIQRGQADEASRVQYGRCSFHLLNTDGRYSPHNAEGPYYGQLTRNVPVRVFVDDIPVFIGEVSEWPTFVDPDAHVRVSASGVLRRLEQGATPEQSVMYRGLMTPLEPAFAPAVYWPCENPDDSGLINAASSEHGNPLVVNASQSGLGSYSGFVCSEPVLTLNNSQVYGDVPSYGADHDPTLAGALVRLPTEGVAANNTPIMVVNCAGNALYWRVRANIDGKLNLQVANPNPDSGSGVLYTSANTSWSILGRHVMLGLQMTAAGLTTNYTLYAWPDDGTAPLTMSDTVASPFTRVWRVVFGSGFNAGATSLGHVAVWKWPTSVDLSAHLRNLVSAYRGETAARRVERICLEEGIPFEPNGDLDDSHEMAPQRTKRALDLILDAADADGGILYEPPAEPTRNIGDGEDSTVGGWGGSGATLVSSTTQVHTGTRSIRVTWNAGPFEAALGAEFSSFFVSGVSYTFSAWVYVPAGDTAVKLKVDATASGPSTVTGQWQQLSVTFTAASYRHTLSVVPNTTPTAGHQVYLDDMAVHCDQPGLALRPIRDLYNQDEALTLDYTLRQVAPPLEPTSDDRWLINDAGVSVEGQGTARYTLTAGPMSVNPPPTGIGRYSREVTRNLLTGRQAFHHARWMVHVGTWDEPRFREITVDVGRWRNLKTAAATLLPGSLIAIDNAPKMIQANQIRQLVYGLRLEINTQKWLIHYNTVPARPFDVFAIGDAVRGRADALDSRLNSAATSTTTSLSVISTAASGRWVTDAAEFPFDINVGGEVMTVTAIAGAGLTQTFTVVRSVNGVVKSHASGIVVALAYTPIAGL